MAVTSKGRVVQIMVSGRLTHRAGRKPIQLVLEHPDVNPVPAFTACNKLTLSPTNKLSSAKILVCLRFLSAPMSMKVGKKVVRMSKSLDPDETASYSPSHLGQSCLHTAL